MKDVTALALLSGGLDSILACRVMMEQSVRVVAIKFVTPFFDDRLLGMEQEYREKMRRKYGIDVRLRDLGPGYMQLLHGPRHGFGKHFNPCIDCKILMLGQARAMMADFGASFLVTGEVLGQRPMSQRRDTLRVIERDSGCEDILLRPLCALRLPETMPERAGLVDRDRLYGFSGRGRRQQMELAARLGITDYPTPAGGCLLTDPNLGERIRRLYGGEVLSAEQDMQIADVRLLLVGRQFKLPGGYWFILGRNQQENEKIVSLAGNDDWLLRMTSRPGPTGLLRRAGEILAGGADEEETCRRAASLVIRYGRKTSGELLPAEVEIQKQNSRRTIGAAPPADEDRRAWQL